MTRFSFQRLDDGKTWGIKASADYGQASRYSGQTVDVTKSNGTTQRVTLGARITSWNGARAAVYEIARDANASKGSARTALRGIQSAFVDDDAIDDAHENEYDLWAATQYAEWHEFTPETTKAYWSYVSQGYADADGYYAPLTPSSWLASFGRYGR